MADAFYVVRNTPTYHLSDQVPDAPDGRTYCGQPYTAATASVVHQEPGEGFTLCKRCAKAQVNRSV